MILPNENISIMLVHNTLGHPSYDLGTLCSAGEKYINKWSKYKPVIHPTINYDTVTPYEWWKATKGNCGLRYTKYDRLSEFITKADNGEDFYVYEPPVGGKDSPYRLGDFRNYSTEAQPPLLANNYDGNTHLIMGNKPFKVKPNFLNANDYSLKIIDIFGRLENNMGKPVPELFFGIALIKETPSDLNMNNVKWKICETSFSTQGGNVDREKVFVDFNIDPNRFDFGWYDLYQFLTPTLIKGENSGESTGGFIACPTENGVPFKQRVFFKKSTYLVGFKYAHLYRKTKTMIVSFQVDNTGGGIDLHFTNTRLAWRQQGQTKDMAVYERVGSFTVKAGSIYTYTSPSIRSLDYPLPEDANVIPYYVVRLIADVKEDQPSMEFGSTGIITNAD